MFEHLTLRAREKEEKDKHDDYNISEASRSPDLGSSAQAPAVANTSLRDEAPTSPDLNGTEPPRQRPSRYQVVEDEDDDSTSLV